MKTPEELAAERERRTFIRPTPEPECSTCNDDRMIGYTKRGRPIPCPDCKAGSEKNPDRKEAA